MPRSGNEVRLLQRPGRRLLGPAVGTAINERREEARDLGWPLQVRQMGHAGQHMARPVRHRRCDMTASFLNVREIEVAPDHKRWRRYLTETMEGGRDIEVRPDRRRP